MVKSKKRYNWRGMVTLLLLFSILVDVISGIVLYVTPSGSIARWTNWSFWGLDKYEWSAIHIIFSMVLIIILLGHLYFNWRILVHFIWNKMHNVVNLKREIATSGIITILLVFGILWNAEPFNSIVNFRETLKRDGNIGFKPGSGGGYGRSVLDFMNQNVKSGTGEGKDVFVHERYGRNRSSNRLGGFGRKAYAETSHQPVNKDTSTLKGRDFVEIGKLENVTGNLVKLGDEWGLKVGEKIYEIHLGPEEYRAYQSFTLTDGEMAMVRGFIFNNDIAVATMETGGKSITLRYETGQPAWSGSGFSSRSGKAKR